MQQLGYQMSTTTLVPLSDISNKAVSVLVDKFNNKKSWLISEIVSLYKSDSAITPEHLLAGIKGTNNIGLAYGAWYVIKSGITPDLLAVSFIGKNYASIQVKTTPEAMLAEIAKVKDEADTAQKAVDVSNALAGTALINALSTLSAEFDKVAKTLPIHSVAAEAQIMLLQVKLDALRAKIVPPAPSAPSVPAAGVPALV
jgi:chaperonin cofactor prefoldin